MHYAKILANRHLFAIVDDVVFVHGGIRREHLPRLELWNEQVRLWMLGEPAFNRPDLVEAFSINGDDGSPIWNRAFGGDVRREVCDELDDQAGHSGTLSQLGVHAMVVGHTVQRDGDEPLGVTPTCGGKVWRIDVGLSRGMWRRNVPLDHERVQVLEIINGREFNILRLPPVTLQE